MTIDEFVGKKEEYIGKKFCSVFYKKEIYQITGYDKNDIFYTDLSTGKEFCDRIHDFLNELFNRQNKRLVFIDSKWDERVKRLISV